MTPTERAFIAELAKLSPRAAARRINEIAEMVSLARDMGLVVIDECTEVFRELAEGDRRVEGREILREALK